MILFLLNITVIDMWLRVVSEEFPFISTYTASYPRRQQCSQ